MKRALLKPHQLFLVAECRAFVLNLVSLTINFDVARFSKRYTIIAPFLAEVFRYELFECAAAVCPLSDFSFGNSFQLVH